MSLFKYAFSNKEQGILEVRLQNNNGQVVLTVVDNGPGLPGDFDMNSGSSLGSMLINTFAAQLEAEKEVEQSKEGAVFTFRFSTDVQTSSIEHPI